MFKFLKYAIDWFVLFTIYKKWLYPKTKTYNFNKKMVFNLFCIYIALVISITLMPIVVSLPNIIFEPYLPMYMVLFGDILSAHFGAVQQLILNILLTIPLGIFLPYLYKTNFIKTTSYTFMLSLTIELVQPLLHLYRSSDINDIVTNTLGGIIGYLCYQMILKIRKEKLS